jgi:hypothetical protein
MEQRFCGLFAENFFDMDKDSRDRSGKITTHIGKKLTGSQFRDDFDTNLA